MELNITGRIYMYTLLMKLTNRFSAEPAANSNKVAVLSSRRSTIEIFT